MTNQLNPNGTPQTSRWYDQVRGFMEAVGQPVGYDYTIGEKALAVWNENPTATKEDLDRRLNENGISVKDLEVHADLLELRLNLLSEEMEEITEADSIENLTKELADLIYVTIGFAVTFGLPLCEVFERVHQSNMSKLGEDGKPIYREDGKVMKGPNYQPPKLEDLF